jgi:hypothetical protein
VVLQLSAEAVRSRIKRGSLQSVKEGNTVYVLLDADQARPNRAPTNDQTTTLIASLQDQVAYLRGELARREETHLEESRRKDSIIAALTQRIPEIEAPKEPSGATEPRESPTEPAGEPERAEPRIPADTPPDVREFAVTPTPQTGRGDEPQTPLEGAQEPRESSEMHMPEAGGGPLARDQQRATERPWWRRVFGG